MQLPHLQLQYQSLHQEQALQRKHAPPQALSLDHNGQLPVRHLCPPSLHHLCHIPAQLHRPPCHPQEPQPQQVNEPEDLVSRQDPHLSHRRMVSSHLMGCQDNGKGSVVVVVEATKRKEGSESSSELENSAASSSPPPLSNGGHDRQRDRCWTHHRYLASQNPALHPSVSHLPWVPKCQVRGEHNANGVGSSAPCSHTG